MIDLGEYIAWCAVIMFYLIIIGMLIPPEMLEKFTDARVMRPFLLIWNWLLARVEALIHKVTNRRKTP